MCYVTYYDCILIWVGWLVWTSYGQDREASLITQHHHRSTTCVGFRLRSESKSGHQGRTEQTARIGAVTAEMVNRFYSATLRGLTVITRAASHVLSNDRDLIPLPARVGI